MRIPDDVRLRTGAAILILVTALLLLGTGYVYEPYRLDAEGADRKLDPGGAENERLRQALRRKVPRGPYIVIDCGNNRLRLMHRGRVQVDAVCSTGSGEALKHGARTWRFDTPQGRFQVRSKVENPVWKRPDWAFIEEGKEIPIAPEDRLEYGSLGDYALDFGQGYLIHGTLYERLLGRSVTHGCIRLGAEALREVYRKAPVGTPIFIF